MFGHGDGGILGLFMAMKYTGRVSKRVAFAPNVSADTLGIEPPIFRKIREIATKDKNPVNRKQALLMLKYPNIPLSDLGRIQCEVMIMSGDRDFVPIPQIVDKFLHIPNSNLCIIPGATHFAPWEKKDLFLPLVTEFFEGPFRKPSTAERAQ